MEKLVNLQRIIDKKLVAVVRSNNPDQAIQLIEAIKDGGIDIIEITMTIPGAIRVIEQVAARFAKKDVLVGAGTVLDSETARACLLAGAEFVVSPYLALDVIKLCNRYQKVVMPGAMTVKEVVEAMEAGADIVKLFPGNAFSPSMISALKGPLPQAPIMPTGGVNLDNVQEWIKAGAVAVGIGGELTKESVKTGDYGIATKIAREFVEKVHSI